VRFDPNALTELLGRDVQLKTPLPPVAEPPLVLATGGFGKRLAEEQGLLLRANSWSDGAGLDYATARGAETTSGMAEFYGRAMPAPPARIREEDFVPLSQLYGRWARIYTDSGQDITPAPCRGRRTTWRSASARVPGTCSTAKGSSTRASGSGGARGARARLSIS
jgi:hypothetical protein